MEERSRKKGSNALRGSGALRFTVRACDMCRKKKIRCEPTGNACLQCVKFNSTCHFSLIPKTRRPRKPIENEYILELEEKLQRVEEQLAVYSKIHTTDNLQRPTSSTTSLGQGSIDHDIRSQNSHSSEQTSVDSMYPERCLVGNPFSRRVYLELPSQATAVSLIKEAFKSFNHSYPIFDEHAFMDSLQDNYTDFGFRDTGWWACINVVLALGHLFRAIRMQESKQENALAYGYLQNALYVVSELITLPQSLSAIQSLIGITLVLEGTPNSQLCSVLIASTMRLAHAMGLHRKDRYPPGLTAAEIQERRNVFWIAYWLDRNVCFTKRQPSAQDDDDIDVELPSGTISESSLDSTWNSSINLFNTRIGLAVIQGQIYKKLFSAEADRQTETQRVNTALELDALLACWRSNVHFDFRDEVVAGPQTSLCEDNLQKIILYFAYIHCVVTVHKYILAQQYSHTNPAFGGQLYMPAAELNVIGELRNAIGLFQKIPRGKYAYIWLLVDCFFDVCIAVLQNVIRNPSHTLARSDILLVEPILQLFNTLAEGEERDDMWKMLGKCQQLVKMAVEAVQIAETSSTMEIGLR